MAAHSGVCGGGGVEGGVLVYLTGVGRPRQARVAAGVVATTDAWQPGILSTRGMDRGEYGNDRPGFGVPPVSQKLVANNY